MFETTNQDLMEYSIVFFITTQKGDSISGVIQRWNNPRNISGGFNGKIDELFLCHEDIPLYLSVLY